MNKPLKSSAASTSSSLTGPTAASITSSGHRVSLYILTIFVNASKVPKTSAMMLYHIEFYLIISFLNLLLIRIEYFNFSSLSSIC